MMIKSQDSFILVSFINLFTQQIQDSGANKRQLRSSLLLFSYIYYIDWKLLFLFLHVFARRSHHLFEFSALSASIFSLYNINKKQYKFAYLMFVFVDFQILQKCKIVGDTFLKLWASMNLPWNHVRSHRPISRFDVYLYINLACLSVCLFVCLFGCLFVCIQ